MLMGIIIGLGLMILDGQGMMLTEPMCYSSAENTTKKTVEANI